MPTPTLRVAATDVLSDADPQNITYTPAPGTGTLASRADHKHKCRQFEKTTGIIITMDRVMTVGSYPHYYAGAILLDANGEFVEACCQLPGGYDNFKVTVTYICSANKTLRVRLQCNSIGAAPSWNMINEDRTFIHDSGNFWRWVSETFTNPKDPYSWAHVGLELYSYDTTPIYIYGIACCAWV